MSSNTEGQFEVSISGREDGAIESIYVKILHDKVARTVEVTEDQLLADYNSADKLIGIEILSPATISQLADLVDAERRDSFLKFIVSTIPKSFVHD